MASVFYALSLPNIYKSEALLAPADSDQQGGLSGLSGQLGGLASLAGVNLGGGKTDKTALAIEILKSREFFAKFAAKHNILPDLMAAKGWNLSDNSVVYDKELYSFEKHEWVRKVKPPKKVAPTMQEAKVAMDKLISVEQNVENGTIKIVIEHYSPVVAKEWVSWIVEDLNAEMKNRDKLEAEESIKYLQQQVLKTNVAEHRALLYELIEEQSKTLMFAEVRDEYVFRVIDKAVIPELKSGPNRALIVFLGAMFGGIISLIICLFFGYKRAANNDKELMV